LCSLNEYVLVTVSERTSLTAAHTNTIEPTANRRRSLLSLVVMQLLVGLAIGAAASWALLFGTLDTATPVVDGVLHFLLPAIAIIGVILALAVPLAVWGYSPVH